MLRSDAPINSIAGCSLSKELAMTSSMIDTLNGIIGRRHPGRLRCPRRVFAPDRPVPLEVRVSAPAAGTNLPVVVFSHGNGWNLDGYSPLTAFWASHGFVVIQPTHLDSRRNGFRVRPPFSDDLDRENRGSHTHP